VTGPITQSEDYAPLMDKDSFTLGVQASGPLARARLEATALVCPKG